MARNVLRRLREAWSGSPDLPAHLRLEQRFIIVRFISLLFVAPILPLLNLPLERLVASYVFISAFAGYNFGIHYLVKRRSPRLKNGYVTTLGDGFSTIIMVMIAGGFNSSVYFMLFATTVAATMRYGYGPSLLVVGIFVWFDATTTFFLAGSSSAAQGDFFLRSGFLVITSLLAGYLREQAHAAEQALARQLDYARALNESTRALSASLDLETVLRSVTVEARRLVAAQEAALTLGASLGGSTEYDRAPELELSAKESEKRESLLRGLVENKILSPVGLEVNNGQSESGEQYMVLPLTNRSGVSGQLAVLRSREDALFDSAEEELLVSFIERASLAIENASLYKTIGDRSRDLKRAYADLAAAHQELLGIDNMKTNFIANVSHELRTPLTSIRSFSELLLSYDVDPETEREFLGIINTESERLTRLINDVLDITKIEAGQVEWRIERYPLADILQVSARTFASLVAAKGMRFSLVPTPEATWVWADYDRIVQVLANLLGNALKFTTQGEIALSAEVRAEEAIIHVRDTGIGIAPEDQERIFEKFSQVGDTLTDKPQGTGLGLCICRDIVTQLGGTMWVDSHMTEGSTFSFSLPIADPPPPAELVDLEATEVPAEV